MRFASDVKTEEGAVIEALEQGQTNENVAVKATRVSTVTDIHIPVLTRLKFS